MSARRKPPQLPDRVPCIVRYSDGRVDRVGTYQATRRGSGEPDLVQVRRAANVRALAAHAAALAWVHGDGRPRLVPVAGDMPVAVDAKRERGAPDWSGEPMAMGSDYSALPVLPERVDVPAGFFQLEDWPTRLAALANQNARESAPTVPSVPKVSTPSACAPAAPKRRATRRAAGVKSSAKKSGGSLAGKVFYMITRGRISRVQVQS